LQNWHFDHDEMEPWQRTKAGRNLNDDLNWGRFTSRARQTCAIRRPMSASAIYKLRRDAMRAGQSDLPGGGAPQIGSLPGSNRLGGLIPEVRVFSDAEIAYREAVTLDMPTIDALVSLGQVLST
jgi:hypothetical protein